ncbi:hypothetical protein A6B43_00335 [Vespertiliibacter pulmonis]|uniref:Uncharacterized protein n=1 Tax=Vespertiliibacter pulmonis TaxID=1443036 RepID=A0A3N4W135_9PAST|nr:hypothetical protein [Vespertiliibacter pulmonis]QLB20094.1 hypothetical protein A6B43_00335 [Vespertiliibacter pulmonis]RPE86059.1 hypothetical protein EDC46_0450 [Vespertiliibacter pulmonis]
MSKLLIDDQPLQVLPALAEAIGLNEALVLQQIHWLLERSRNQAEGKSWVYNTYEQWRENHFRFFSLSTVRRTIDNLEKLGLLISTTKFNKMKVDKTKWYSIDYQALNALEITTAKNDRPSAQNEQSNGSNWTDVSVQFEQTNNQENIQETPTRDIKKTTQKKSADLDLLEEFGITGQLAEDFIRLRKSKNAPISKTALSRLEKQADLAKLPLREVVEIMIERNWQGFKADWDWQNGKPRASNGTTAKDSFSDENTDWWVGKTIEIRGQR